MPTSLSAATMTTVSGIDKASTYVFITNITFLWVTAMLGVHIQSSTVHQANVELPV